MRDKYNGKWYKTLVFAQKTTTFKPDGTTENGIWYEALSMPGKLRVDFHPLESGGGVIYANGINYTFRDGKLAGSRRSSTPCSCSDSTFIFSDCNHGRTD
jgi:hypothetical protein